MCMFIYRTTFATTTQSNLVHNTQANPSAPPASAIISSETLRPTFAAAVCSPGFCVLVLVALAAWSWVTAPNPVGTIIAYEVMTLCCPLGRMIVSRTIDRMALPAG